MWDSVSFTITSFHGGNGWIAVMFFVAAAKLAYPSVMRSVEEIEAEIAKLPSAPVRQVAKWLAEYEAELWIGR